MGNGLSMTAKHEITRKFALAFAGASKRDKGRLLDEVCAITGWSRANARRQLTAARKPRRVGKKTRRPRARKYSDASVQVLQKVWAWTGGMSGKYLAVSMRMTLDLLESHGECVVDRAGYSTQVRGELLSMSAATMDRYLEPARRKTRCEGSPQQQRGHYCATRSRFVGPGMRWKGSRGFLRVTRWRITGRCLKASSLAHSISRT